MRVLERRRRVAELLVDAGIDAHELLVAVSLLCQPVPAAGFDFDDNRRMVMVFIEGLSS